MKNKGFTLAELLGVMTILVLVTLIAFTPIINSIRNSKNNMSEVTEALIYGAAKIYVSNNSSLFPIVDNGRYCIKLQTLVDSGDLMPNLRDSNNNELIDMNKNVIVIVENDKYKYEMDIKGEC